MKDENEKAVATSQDEAIRKIKQILRLAHRTTEEGESRVALATARRLAVKYGVSLEVLESEATPTIQTGCLTEEPWRTRGGIEMGFITPLLAKHFGVALMQHMKGDKVRFAWVGTRVNIEVAKFAFAVLSRASVRDWKEASHIKETSLGGLLHKQLQLRRIHQSKYYNRVGNTFRMDGASSALKHLNEEDFYRGWFTAIDEKLTRNPLRNDVELFRQEKAQMKEALHQMEGQGAQVKSEGHKGGRLDDTALMMGYSAGSQVNLSRPVEGTENECARMLTK